MSSEKVQDWSNQRLQKEIKDAITKMFESVLDFSEVAVGEEKRYKVLRRKILRLGNDTIRSLNNTIAKDYQVRFNGLTQDVVRVTKGRGEGNGK